MTPADRQAAATARTKAKADEARQAETEARKRKQAKLREETARDSRIPARMVRP